MSKGGKISLKFSKAKKVEGEWEVMIPFLTDEVMKQKLEKAVTLREPNTLKGLKKCGYSKTPDKPTTISSSPYRDFVRLEETQASLLNNDQSMYISRFDEFDDVDQSLNLSRISEFKCIHNSLKTT